MELPAAFAALELARYAVTLESDRLFLPERPWRFTCLACGRVFRPLPTAEAVASMRAHLTIRAGQPARCGA